MNVPALAAQAPAGATQTITGTCDSSSAWVIWSIESRLPPGVLSLITTAAAPSLAAEAMPSER